LGQPLSFIQAIVIDPITPTTVYAGGNSSGGGVSKSIDGGVNWQPINNGLANNFVLSLAIDPITPSTVYAGLNGGLFKSVNGGDSWTAIKTGFISAITIDPVTTSTIYISGDFNGGVSKSIDGGSTWVSVGVGPKAGFVLAVKVNPLKPSTIYTGGQNFPSDNDAFVTKINQALPSFTPHYLVAVPLPMTRRVLAMKPTELRLTCLAMPM